MSLVYSIYARKPCSFCGFRRLARTVQAGISVEIAFQGKVVTASSMGGAARKEAVAF